MNFQTFLKLRISILKPKNLFAQNMGEYWRAELKELGYTFKFSHGEMVTLLSEYNVPHLIKQKSFLLPLN